jgi:Fe-S cluster assembly protein SufD
MVQPDAQKIDAYQLNRNLLLSPSARVNTKPQLEILADDVKCTHGATVGQLDDDQLFYLQSRGLSPSDAKTTLTYAFAAEVIESIRVPSIAESLRTHAHQTIGKHAGGGAK